jgi:hypothetical protein
MAAQQTEREGLLMRLIARAAIAGACLAAAAPAAAQGTTPAPSSTDIVVTGQRGQEQQVSDFVAALTPSPDGAIPRFVDAVCPAAAGLLPAQNEAVAARLRQVAAAVGLKAAPQGCAPNAFVVVTDSKRAFIETLAKRRPQTFGFISPRALRGLAYGRERAAAWQLSGAVDRKDRAQRYNDVFSGSPSEAWETVARARANPRGFDAAVLVVEMGAVNGLTATQVADYAAMRLFARLDPARLPAQSPPTILTALEAPMGSEVPVTLTQWDAGFLRGLYASGFNRRAAVQRAEIAGKITQALESPRQ